jgi:superfamily I DNA/RNA helicase
MNFIFNSAKTIDWEDPKISFKKKRRKVRPPRVKYNWSKYQKAIFNDVAEGSGHTIVLAAPGSGKTSTIKEATYRVPGELSAAGEVLCCAFNKTIAENLNEELPGAIEASTFHRIGFRTVQKQWNSFGINASSVDKEDLLAEFLAKKLVPKGSSPLIKNLIVAMRLAKAELRIDPEEIELLCYEHGIRFCEMHVQDFCWTVRKMILMTVNEPGMIDGKSIISFDDMLFLPWYHNWDIYRKFERVFIDEAQDLSAVRKYIVLKCLRSGGRLSAYADPNQAIFAFCGASKGVVDDLATDLSAKKMPLSVSYRLPKKVVELVQTLNPSIEYAENAIEGNVKETAAKDILSYVKSGDAIISRTNFQLIKNCFHLVNNGVRANIMGRDIGSRLLWRIECWKPNSVNELKNDVNQWREEICQSLKNNSRSTDCIEDEAECILNFCNNANNLGELKGTIKDFFVDNNSKNSITLTTAHKAKGLEWDRVVVLEDTYKKDSGVEEEENIWYVALTRPKDTLMIAKGNL